MLNECCPRLAVIIFLWLLNVLVFGNLACIRYCSRLNLLYLKYFNYTVMTLVAKLLERHFFVVKYVRLSVCPERLLVTRLVSHQPDVQPDTDEEFRVLDLKKTKTQATKRRKFEKRSLLPPRANQMHVDQDWSNVWPGPRSFHPASVPLPVRQGYPKKKEAPPGKFGNAELMKIPNFLHLTPPAIKKHCQALKRFCTAWPQNLDKEQQEQLFPLEVITSDYCHSSPTIRDPMARIVTVKVKLKDLVLDQHAKDKFLRLVGERYDPDTDVVTIVTDRCPLRKQNYDYAMYILTALYHESWNIEPWESEKSEVDMEYYDWDRNVSRQSITRILSWPDGEDSQLDLDNMPHVQEYKNAVSAFFNEGEDEYIIYNYKQSVKKLFNLHEDQFTAATQSEL